MIIDSPILLRLPIGTDRIIPGADDARVTIPPSIQPITQPLQPNTNIGPGLVEATGSLFASALVILNNLAAGSGNLMHLPKGLYEIVCQLSAIADFATPATGTPMYQIVMFQDSLASGNHLAAVYCGVNVPAQVWTKHRFLLDEPFTIRYFYAATTVGQHASGIFSVAASRIL